MTPRRFPPPWSAEVQPNHYVVRDANKQRLAYVYFEDEPEAERSAAELPNGSYQQFSVFLQHNR